VQQNINPITLRGWVFFFNIILFTPHNLRPHTFKQLSLMGLTTDGKTDIQLPGQKEQE